MPPRWLHHAGIFLTHSVKGGLQLFVECLRDAGFFLTCLALAASFSRRACAEPFSYTLKLFAPLCLQFFSAPTPPRHMHQMGRPYAPNEPAICYIWRARFYAFRLSFSWATDDAIHASTERGRPHAIPIHAMGQMVTNVAGCVKCCYDMEKGKGKNCLIVTE